MAKEHKPREPYAIARKVVTFGLIATAVLVVGCIALGVVLFIRAENARQAEQARLAADPVTVSGVYNALNKERATVGAPALSTLTNLTTAAEQQCNDFVTAKYFDYKNPATGKESGTFIKDNVGDLYLKTYTASIFSAIPASQTATDAVNGAISKQAENLNDPVFNSVGWAACQSPTNPAETYIIGMLANKQEKPAAPAVKYVPTPTPTPTPSYTPPPIDTGTTCNTYYNSFGASTHCY